MVQLRSALIVVSGTLAVSTTFIANDQSVGFALNIPSGNNNELYFTLEGPSSSSWMVGPLTIHENHTDIQAVGLGSDTMKNALVLMAYADSTGRNVTLSPRNSAGQVEPVYNSSISITILAGTGITNDTMTVNAKCSDCRSWKNGSLNPQSTTANFIYAAGPAGTIKSSSKSESVKRHDEYGTFTMDLTKAVGPGAVPLPGEANSPGTTETSNKTDHDYAGAAHACIMVLVFVGLLPVGVAILRLLNAPKWHGFAQTFSMLLALIGAGLGIYIGTLYTRSNKFNSAHQVIGLLVIIAMVGQGVIGFMHHRVYKQTQTPTTLAPIHIWLGRFVILFGIINGFIGFPFARNTKYNVALVGVILLVFIVLVPLMFFKWKRSQKRKEVVVNDPEGYNAQPWQDQNVNLTTYPPPYYYQQPVQPRSFD
ncbi:hypothetical protein B7494_g3353 [Chlorociboria aeruginascens]|nr:hypothetical protein B7494_g3353 [Chlorociboria aeruginascens]